MSSLNSPLINIFIERISSGLRRRSITTPSRWARAIRVMGPPFPGLWTFKYHPWLEEMHDSKNEINVGQKSAQMGYTETVLNITFFKIDVESIDCLYVLPSKNPDAGEFSAGRFDPALELSPHLSNLFSDVKNVGHKRAGATNLYIRGSKSRSGLKSIPVGLLVLDEVDEMNQDNIALARERMSGQRTKLEWLISTPTIDYHGINKYYNLSTQESYFFRCPGCSRFTNLLFPECLVITGEDIDDHNLINSYLQCKECHHKLDHATKHEWLSNNISGINPNVKGSQAENGGRWIANVPNRDIRGFHVNQLYSSTVSPYDLAKAYLRAQRDPADEQTFWNDKIGVPHIVEGAKITDHQLESARGSYPNGDPNFNHYNLVITMGVDVGKYLHYEIDAWTLDHSKANDISVDSRVRVIEIGKLTHFEQLDDLMRKYRITMVVIDANPERRKAFEFANRFAGHVKMCFYGAGIRDKRINEPKDKLPDEPTITVDRTSWLDLSLGRFRNGTIVTPMNVPYEYRDQLKSLTRIYEKDKEGNPIGRYVTGSKDDHFAHSRNYAEIALPFGAHLTNPYNIRSPI